MKKLKDQDKMPFGKHKGKRMEDVPAQYFHWLWTDAKMKDDDESPVAQYIRDNLNCLELEFPEGIWE